MKNFLFSLLLLVPLIANAAPIGNEDVIRMVQGGLNDATVMQAIDAGEPAFDTSTDGLLRLKQGGVSERVIQRIIAIRSVAPAPAPVPVAPPPPACPQCGTIVNIREITKPGTASGTGAVVGGILGGVLGNQVSNRRNRTAGTVVGAAGGAVAGHMIEKKASEGKTFAIDVQFDDNSARTFNQDTHPSWNPGIRVRLVNGVLTPL